jgi:hypothetical protein
MITTTALLLWKLIAALLIVIAVFDLLTMSRSAASGSTATKATPKHQSLIVWASPGMRSGKLSLTDHRDSPTYYPTNENRIKPHSCRLDFQACR